MSEPPHTPDDTPAARPASRSDERRTAAEAFYGPLADHADGARRVGWESGPAHGLRLAAIAEALVPLDALGSIVDVGCGEGALLPVLRAAGFAGAYRGEDLLEAPLRRAIGRFGADPLATFVAADGFAAGSPDAPRAAAIVCSGALNTIAGVGIDHDREVRDALAALWERASEVLAVDFAVADRHVPGVGLGRADLASVWAHARAIAPVVVVREDVIPGEALLVLSRSRAAAFARRVPDAYLRAEALLVADEPAAALALVGAVDSAEIAFVRGRALAALGRSREALNELVGAAMRFDARGDPRARDAARLAQAPVLWRLGDKRAAEALLTELARHHDEARAHLFELTLAKKDVARAAALVDAITDPWIRRELSARLSR